MTTPLAYDLDAVAARLSVKRRFLADWLRAHPWDADGQPFVSAIAGKKKLFTESDIRRIFAALPKPEAQPCPSSSARRTRNTQHGAFAGRTTESTLTAALALAREKTPKNSSLNGPRKSNVVSMPDRKTRRSPVQP
jgi:hypothetical protein